MPTTVRDEGLRSAKLVLVGEAPGTREMAVGRPFVGPSGRRLEVWWRHVGLARDQFYITNVVPFQPDSIDRIPRDEMERYIAALRERLEALDEPWVIIPTGNYALYAVTGLGRVSWTKKTRAIPGISDWRGSILSTTLRGRTVKVIPTLHPAFVLRMPGMERLALADWQRIAYEAQSPKIELPNRYHHINPSVADVRQFVDHVIRSKCPVALDIETPPNKPIVEFQLIDGTWHRDVPRDKRSLVARYASGKKKGELKMRKVRAAGQYLACIGLAIEVDHSITVPLCGPDRDAMRREIARLLATSNDKVTQNGISFDLPWLRREGFVINGRLFDTRAMHHALDPRGNHDLAEMASIYTRQPYWKHEAGQYVFGDKLQRYCGLDTCVTLELFFTFHDLLHDAGLWEFYLRHYVDLAPALLDMTMHGIGVDRARMVAERQRLDADMQRLIAEITEEAGMPLVAKTGLSNDRLKFYLFGAKGFPGVRGEKTYAKLAATYPNAKCLNLPPKWKKNTKGDSSVTTDEVALRTLILKYPDKLGSIGPKLLDLRDKKKMAEFLEESMIDSDGRVRCSFSFVTEAGRLASAATPWGTGRNLMNIPHGARSVFVPDEGQG